MFQMTLKHLLVLKIWTIMKEGRNKGLQCWSNVKGSCVRSLGDVCVRFSEWFINEKWESDDDDDSCETDVCESPN